MNIRIEDLMASSGVGFGTSGARGLAEDMTDFVCYAYTTGFLQYLESIGEISKGSKVAVAGDLRPSTDRIMHAVGHAASDMGYAPVSCGKIPTPAIALYGISKKIPTVMVTGSHIPADRNGIKFNKSSGEILKQDEAAIREQTVEIDDRMFTKTQSLARPCGQFWPACDEACSMYVRRYRDVFPNDCLSGLRIGVYQHSAVGRNIMVKIFDGLGAEVEPLAPSDAFVPVDTEAMRQEDVELARKWVANRNFDAIVSTDGDSDRPLIADENGRWLRGDVAGILCAKFLGADSVSTPVSCNTAVERCGCFAEVRRTRIGSPYVIASMNDAVAAGAKTVVGYEANGGFLTNSDIELFGGHLAALPTRDSIIVHLSILLTAAERGRKVSELTAELPRRFTASDGLKEFPADRSNAILKAFDTGDLAKDRTKATEVFGPLCGKCEEMDRTDGIRMIFENEEIVHLRPSGNAPEFRCYNEAADPQRAINLNAACMKILEELREKAARPTDTVQAV